MRALVTGGAGFIGSHLSERLIREGFEVICLDNLSTGREKNIQHLYSNSRFTFVNADVRAPYSFDVDYIYNLACPASPKKYCLDPIATIETCVIGAQNALELACRAGARIFQASTSEVYGDPAIHPQPTHYWGNVNPIGPRSCYDEGKRCAEALCFAYARTKAVNFCIGRIFNTYGPRMSPDDGRVVSTFISQATFGLPLTIHGSGVQTRSLCFVDDLIDVIVLFSMSSSTIGPLNLGNDQEISIIDLAGVILKLCESRSTIVHVPKPEDDPRRRRPDLGVTASELGWKPRVSLEDGLRQTISDYRKQAGSEPRLVDGTRLPLASREAPNVDVGLPLSDF